MANDYEGGDRGSKQRGLFIQDYCPLSNNMVYRAMHCSGGIRPYSDRVGCGYRRICQSHWGHLLSLVGQAPRCPLFHPGAPSRWSSRENRRGYWERSNWPTSYSLPKNLCRWDRRELRRQPQPTPNDLISARYIHLWFTPHPNAAISGFQTRCLRGIRVIIWARIRIHSLSSETISRRFWRHGGLRNSGRQKASSTHILFTLQWGWPRGPDTISICDVRSDSFRGHSLHRVVFPLRHIARTMDVENTGHPRFRRAHLFCHHREPRAQQGEWIHLDEG